MFINKGGQRVNEGTYWEVLTGHRIDVAEEGMLPGAGKSTYIRMSSGMMLLAGPIIGLLYAILMPFIGIATVAILAGRKMLEGLSNLATKSVSFGWRPTNAYLAGKKKKNTGTK